MHQQPAASAAGPDTSGNLKSAALGSVHARLKENGCERTDREQENACANVLLSSVCL